MKIGAHHGAEEEQRQSDADCKFGQRVANLGFQITGQPGEIAKRDKSEDKEDGFNDRRHDFAE